MLLAHFHAFFTLSIVNNPPRGLWRICHTEPFAIACFFLYIGGAGSPWGLAGDEKKMDMKTKYNELPDFFPALSRKVTNLVERVRACLFGLDADLAKRLVAECSILGGEARKTEADCNAGLLIGVCGEEERMSWVRCAQQCSRLGRIVHQCSRIVQDVQEIAAHLTVEEMASFKPLFLLAEMELKDAILSIMRDDSQLAFVVKDKDEELDVLYAREIERIFKEASGAMFYDFRMGAALLSILRAIERIGDHAKQLAVPSFYLLAIRSKKNGANEEGI